MCANDYIHLIIKVDTNMYQVLYYSRGGNTRKLADAIAEELKTKATDVKGAPINPEAGVIFLGSGSYGGRPGEDMIKFIEAHDFTGRKVALFSTSWMNAGKEIDTMASALKGKGAAVLGNYHCKGKSFSIFNRGHPNQEDMAGAKKFAQEMAKLG
jgi:flavodoxin I